MVKAMKSVRSQLPPVVLVCVMFLALVFCSVTARGQDDGTNLLLNGSFESGGAPALEGWSPGNPALATIVSPGGPSGGNWSLRLEADWAPTTGFVTQVVTGVQSGDILELRADVKAEETGGGGAIRLVTGETFWGGRSKSAATDSEIWTTLSVVDTLELAEGDSVWVCLTSFNTEVTPRIGLFDSVSLTLLGQTPVLSMTWGALKSQYK